LSIAAKMAGYRFQVPLVVICMQPISGIALDGVELSIQR
jgi:hypothetical protein